MSWFSQATFCGAIHPCTCSVAAAAAFSGTAHTLNHNSAGKPLPLGGYINSPLLLSQRGYPKQVFGVVFELKLLKFVHHYIQRSSSAR